MFINTNKLIFSIINILFLISTVLCKNCTQIQHTTMILPEKGFNIFSDYMQGRRTIDNKIKLYHPIIYATAKFSNGVRIFAGVLKSDNSHNYNYKFMFVSDRRRKYTKFNKRKPIYRAIDVKSEETFRKKDYSFKLDYDECTYVLRIREQRYIRHLALL